MWFIAHVNSYDQYKNQDETDNILIYANSYTEAMERIEGAYGKSIEEITLLEAITDSTVLYLSDEVEQGIRDNEYNCF